MQDAKILSHSSSGLHDLFRWRFGLLSVRPVLVAGPQYLQFISAAMCVLISRSLLARTHWSIPCVCVGFLVLAENLRARWFFLLHRPLGRLDSWLGSAGQCIFQTTTRRTPAETKTRQVKNKSATQNNWSQEQCNHSFVSHQICMRPCQENGVPFRLPNWLIIWGTKKNVTSQNVTFTSVLIILVFF